MIQEGGGTFTNAPNDHGGPTKFGVTLKTFNDFFKTSANEEVIMNMTQDIAKKIYRTNYWEHLLLDRMSDTHPEIALILFDQAVNRGTFGAVKMLQRSINDVWKQKIVVEDGGMGEKTLSELKKLPKLQIGLQLFKNIQLGYVRIVKQDPTQLIFLEGWTNRTHEILNTLTKDFA